MCEYKNAYFASGCFWCITPAFQESIGVRKVTSGYCGGREENPSYQDVKSQKTGHRETVMVTYNPEKISYGELMEIFRLMFSQKEKNLHLQIIVELSR